MGAPECRIRIGELSRRVGVSTDRLRVWERRYGLLRPVRTSGGFRLYSGEDELRVRAMQRQLAAGLSAAEAAAAVRAADAQGPGNGAAGVERLREELGEALAAFDAVRVHALLDRLLADAGSNEAMRAVIFPFLHDLGERWARAEISVGHEHFASSLLQARLVGLLRGSNRGAGPMALLACPPNELHTLGLAGFGIALRNRGWRITYLGADTPIASLRDTAAEITPAVVVLAAALSTRFADVEHELRDLAAHVHLALAGAGASPALAHRVGARLLDTDPVTAAETLTAASVPGAG
ncbi:MAG: MerR family transcriptional regulator [Actinomycetota bacterium]|nr:MerR family transcriptional regulator [Actinomycetota bacterium]